MPLLWPLLLLLLLCSPPPASCAASCQPDWLPIGSTDCVLLGTEAMNISQARQHCNLLGNGSRLLLLRNYRFNQQLLAALNESGFNSSVTYWTGAYYDQQLRVRWLDADYTDASMSVLPGNAVPSERYRGYFGSLVFDPATSSLVMKFLAANSSGAIAQPICARQPLESPYQPVVPYDPALRCPGPGARLHRGLCYLLANAPVQESARWDRDDALAVCRKWFANASLAVVNDFNTGFFATALISAEANGHTWLGLGYRTQGYWAWSDEATTEDMRHSDWKLNEPTKPFASEPCVVAHQREASVGEWNNVRCSDAFASALCQAAPAVAKGYTAQPIGLDSSSNGSKCRPDFYHYGEACWLLATNSTSAGSNRSAMAAECASRDANLAFFHQRGEQAFLSALAEQLGGGGGLNYSVWLGLNVRHDGLDGWQLTWDDGSRADYDFVWQRLPTQLKVHQPAVNASEVKLCTALHLASNAMVARLCSDTEPRLACRYNLHSHSLAPNNSQELVCSTGQPAVNGKCFRLVLEKKDWDKAHEECRNTGNGSLASVHSREELDAVIRQLGDSDDAWIGMAVIDREGRRGLAWLDDSPVDFYQFRHGHPQKPLGMGLDQLCVSISSRYGEWRTKWCNQALSFVCQTPGLPVTTTAASAVTTATTPPAESTSLASTTATSSSGAGDGGGKASSASSTPTAASTSTTPAASTVAASATTPIERDCRTTSTPGPMASVPTPDGADCVDYLLWTTEPLDWNSASGRCRQLLPPDGALASVESDHEDVQLLGLLLRLNMSTTTAAGGGTVWIGGSTQSSRVANAFSVWPNGDAMRFVKFAVSNSDGDHQATGLISRRGAGGGVCTAFTFTGPHDRGAWPERRCSDRLPFLCKRTRRFDGGRVTTQAPKSTPAPPAAAACPAGWSAAADDAACYRLLDEPVIFSQVGAACAAVGGLPASYQTPRQLQLMASLLVDYQPAWIGLAFNKSLGGGVFAWLDGRPVNYADWATFSSTPELDCVWLGASRYWWLSGHMRSAPCWKKRRPLCRRQADAARTAVRAHAGCPDGFWRFNASCYLVSDTAVVFTEAVSACHSHGAHLLELDDSLELHFLRAVLPDYGSVEQDEANAVWLSLHVDGRCGGGDGRCNWTWASGRQLRFDLIYPAAAFSRLSFSSTRGGDCYALNANRGLLVSRCVSQRRRYVCEKPATPDGASPAPTPTAQPAQQCRRPSDGQFRYRGNWSVSADGRPCARWDVALAEYETRSAAPFVNASDLKAIGLLSADDFLDETIGQAAAYCRDANRGLFSGRPFCFVWTADGSKLQAAACNVPLCGGDGSASPHGSVAVVVIMTLCCAAALAGLAVIGYRLWSRGRWAAGYRPQLNLDSSTGLAQPAAGTSFHNPIYMPANC